MSDTAAAAVVASLADTLDPATAHACLERISTITLGGSARSVSALEDAGLVGVVLRMLREASTQPTLAASLMSTLADMCTVSRCRTALLRAGAILVVIKVLSRENKMGATSHL